MFDSTPSLIFFSLVFEVLPAFMLVAKHEAFIVLPDLFQDLAFGPADFAALVLGVVRRSGGVVRSLVK